MERSLPEIHSKLQETLENFLHLDWRQDEAGCSQVGDQLQQVAVKLEEEDIVSMQDLAVACFDPMFWRHYSIHCKQYDQHVVCGNKFLKQTAEDLLCLLKPAEEELLLPPADVRIWEAFAAAKMQHRQFSIVTAFGGYERSLPESNELVQSMQMKFEDLLSSFQEAQLHMDGQGLLSPKLKTQMTAFAKRLNSCCRGVVTSMKDRKDGHLSSVLFPGLGKAKLRWSQLASEAAQIAAEVRELTSDANSEVNSWSLIGNAEAEVGSIASGHSVDSQMSCLSGHGGPHCFLPSYLFKSLQSEGTVSSTSTIWARANDRNPNSCSHVDVLVAKK